MERKTKKGMTLYKFVRGMKIGEIVFLRVINNRVWIGRYDKNEDSFTIMNNYSSISLLSMSSMITRLRDHSEPMEAWWCYDESYRKQGLFRILRFR